MNHAGSYEKKIHAAYCHEYGKIKPSIGSAFSDTVMVFLDQGQLSLRSDDPKDEKGDDEAKKRNY